MGREESGGYGFEGTTGTDDEEAGLMRSHHAPRVDSKRAQLTQSFSGGYDDYEGADAYRRAYGVAAALQDGTGGGAEVFLFFQGLVLGIFFGVISCWCCAPRGGRDRWFLAGATVGTVLWILAIAVVGSYLCCLMPESQKQITQNASAESNPFAPS